jgi:hypothetical protein
MRLNVPEPHTKCPPELAVMSQRAASTSGASWPNAQPSFETIGLFGGLLILPVRCQTIETL